MKRLLLLIALLLGFGAPAEAASNVIVTPILFVLNSAVYCTETNFATVKATIGITAYNGNAQQYTQQTAQSLGGYVSYNTCDDGPVPSGHSCQLVVGFTTDGYGSAILCRTESNQLKTVGAMQILSYTSGGSIQSVVVYPASKP